MNPIRVEIFSLRLLHNSIEVKAERKALLQQLVDSTLKVYVICCLRKNPVRQLKELLIFETPVGVGVSNNDECRGLLSQMLQNSEALLFVCFLAADSLQVEKN